MLKIYAYAIYLYKKQKKKYFFDIDVKKLDIVTKN